GKLENGEDIAVKKLSNTSNQGKREFVNEAKLLARVQHCNVVSLLGYCVSPEKLLVYEYVANESLDKLLFKSPERNVLDWTRRYDIIVGVVKGLLYLHEDLHDCIIDREIKAILELINGQKNFNFNLDPECQNLLEWAYKLYKKGKGLEILESGLASTANSYQVVACIKIGLLCTQSDHQMRPTMSRIVLMLSRRKSGTLEEPTQPGSTSTTTTTAAGTLISDHHRTRCDDRVEKRCAEMDARLDALSIDFDEELYPHMLTAIAGRLWVIGHGLRLAVMKCAKSIELRQAFTNVVSAGIAKGMSEILAHGIEHGKAGRGLEVVEAYDPEANSKYLQALQELKDLKYLIVDQLEGLKDASMEIIMASLHLESDSGEDAPKWIRDLRPSTSQLKIHVYLEVRDPRDPWAVKEEILLEEAITANVSRAEKKMCRVVCRTHGVGSAHHARSDSVHVSVPTVAPQGLAILLTDAATQTETSEDDASLRFLRSKSLPPMYNLDLP
nr:putative receptor-like protein kinase At4g00960 [Tanacetum cinerariifolium]